MAECKACEDLRNDAPEFAENGVTDAVCNSLKNDTGLDASNGHNNCTDMDNATKCLIGNMVDELERYDTCTWKKFMKIFLTNLFAILNAINCSLCGVWVNIHNLWADIARIWAAIQEINNKITNILSRLTAAENTLNNHTTQIQNINTTLNNHQTQLNNINNQTTKNTCVLSQLTRSRNFSVGINEIRRAPGVSWREDDTGIQSEPKITGNAYVGYMTGSFVLSESWMNNHPNSSLNEVGALVYEYRIKMSEHNLAYIWPGQMQEVANGKCVHAHIQRFGEGDVTYGNDGKTGTGSTTVPSGYTYLQVRITSYESLGNGNLTLAGVIPVRMNEESFDC